MLLRTIALVLACLIAPGLSYAQPPTVHTQMNGLDGVWLRLDLAQDALGCMDAREPTARQIRLLEADLEIRTRTEAELRASYAEAGRALLAADERSNALRRELRRPRHNAWIWLSVGLVVGVAGSVTIAVVTR